MQFVCMYRVLFNYNSRRGIGMSVGHKIIEPSGKYSVVFAENHDQIVDRVNSM